jgi:hypothetical protein
MSELNGDAVTNKMLSTAAIAYAFALVPACAGESDATKATSNAGGSSAGSSNDDASASGGSGTGGSTGGSGGSSGGGNGGSIGGSDGSIDGSGGTVGGGSDGAVSEPPRVLCSGASGPGRECAPGEYCCDDSCTSRDMPCSRATIRCDGAADCPNAFCCMTKISKRDGGPQVATCRPSCDADAELVMCRHSSAADDCPTGMQCQITATLPPLYGYCCAPGSVCPTT